MPPRSCAVPTSERLKRRARGARELIAVDTLNSSARAPARLIVLPVGLVGAESMQRADIELAVALLNEYLGQLDDALNARKLHA